MRTSDSNELVISEKDFTKQIQEYINVYRSIIFLILLTNHVKNIRFLNKSTNSQYYYQTIKILLDSTFETILDLFLLILL